METYFAAPQRSDQDELQRQIEQATHNPVIDGILCMAGGLVAVLNHHRQIIAINPKMLEALGVDDPNEVTGLRPGEALHCIYGNETAAGCGTSPHCVTCGAAIAIISTLGTQGSVDKTCTMTVKKNGQQVDLFFNVHASTFKIEQERFILIFLQDITHQQYQAALERAFFHDIKNSIMGLLQASELLSVAPPGHAADLVNNIVNLSKRLSNEVALQRHLSNNGECQIGICRESLQVDAILKEMQKAISLHPSMAAHRLKLFNDAPGLVIFTDLSLLLRVLANMLINAFEADDTDHDVHLTVDVKGTHIIFSVWNRNHISRSVCRRIFQRNFSTKDETGRGLGTYSMKLVGEQLLGGRVWFESAPDKGTRFYLSLPISIPQ